MGKHTPPKAVEETTTATTAVDQTSSNENSEELETQEPSVDLETSEELQTEGITDPLTETSQDSDEPNLDDPELSNNAAEKPAEETQADEVTTKSDETQTDETQQEKPVVESTASAILADKSLGDIRVRLHMIAQSNDLSVNILAAKLLAYNESMGVGIITPDKGAAVNYDLYSYLIDVLKIENYNSFKPKMDIINIVFKEFSTEAYSEHMLHRFDTAWEKRWGKQTLTTYQHMVTLIAMLCDLSTRKKNLDRISFDVALNQKDTFFTDTIVNNLKKYYQV